MHCCILSSRLCVGGVLRFVKSIEIWMFWTLSSLSLISRIRVRTTTLSKTALRFSFTKWLIFCEEFYRFYRITSSSQILLNCYARAFWRMYCRFSYYGLGTQKRWVTLYCNLFDKLGKQLFTNLKGISLPHVFEHVPFSNVLLNIGFGNLFFCVQYLALLLGIFCWQ